MNAKWAIIFVLCLGFGSGRRTVALCPKAKMNRSSHHAAFPPLTSKMVAGYATTSEPNRSYVALSSTTESSSDLGEEIGATTSKASTVPPQLYSVDVRYDLSSPLTYDPKSGRFLMSGNDATTFGAKTKNQRDETTIQRMNRLLHSAFVPEGVSRSYYRFMRWRILQRFVNANVHVIGTQSLLMGLRGMQRSSSAGALGAAAATNWVLKDTLGKVVRMAWASKMGRKFDPDAKRWRFRAALIYAVGNGLEVSTYLHPNYFLVLAMLANSCKQMSMLTSSATRNALYNSFRKLDGSNDGGNASNSTTVGYRRGSGGSENIGDITAKGEAQIAVVELFGIASGICLSRAVGVSMQNVLAVWIILQVMETFCMYHELRAVEYKTFNFERMYTVLGELLEERDGDQMLKTTISTPDFKFAGNIPTPGQIASKERIFLPPDHLARRAIAFGSPGRTLLDPDELDMLINDVFRGEKYFLVVGQDIKNARGLSANTRQWIRKMNGSSGIDPQEQCHIVLHADANNIDILKSALALVILRKKLVAKVANCDQISPTLRSRDCADELREARAEACDIFPQLLRELTNKGWRPPLRSMLGRVSARAEWTIQRNVT